MAFQVTVTSLSGERKQLRLQDGQQILASLVFEVADAFNVPSRGVLLCENDRVLSEHRKDLHTLGIYSGAELQLICQPSTEIVEYRVMQTSLLKKPGEDPEVHRLIKLKRAVGSKICTTGKIWVGPKGGSWVELDTLTEKQGWLLIEGPGFDRYGPLLEKVEPGEAEPIVLHVWNRKVEMHACDVCVKPTQTINKIRYWIATHYFGLREKQIFLRLKGMTDMKYIRDTDVMLKDSPFQNSDELEFFYLGHPDDDMVDKVAAQEVPDNEWAESIFH